MAWFAFNLSSFVGIAYLLAGDHIIMVSWLGARGEYFAPAYLPLAQKVSKASRLYFPVDSWIKPDDRLRPGDAGIEPSLRFPISIGVYYVIIEGRGTSHVGCSQKSVGAEGTSGGGLCGSYLFWIDYRNQHRIQHIPTYT
jgi:hypothetical protein